jgi:hypothetical protein
MKANNQHNPVLSLPSRILIFPHSRIPGNMGKVELPVSGPFRRRRRGPYPNGARLMSNRTTRSKTWRPLVTFHY